MVEIKVPELAESISEGTVLQWLINVGDTVTKGEGLVELETDKVNVEVNADFSGVLAKVLKEPGDTVEIGEVIAIVEDRLTEATSSAPVQENSKKPIEVETKQSSFHANPEPQKTEKTATDRPIASPAARKLARELGLDLRNVQSSDPLGRIRPHDVKAHNPDQGHVSKEVQKVEKANSKSAQVQIEFDKPVERVKMSRRRQTIAKRLVEVSQTAAMLTTFNEVDMSAVMDLRKKRKDHFFDKHSVRLGFMSFFTKAVVAALRQFPLLNAEIQGNELVLKKFYDIGIAVAAPDGLVVPIVRDANQKSFAQIEQDIVNLGKKARDNTLALKDLQGGTFTITNGGVFGSLMSTPILNSPQVGILGMHTIQTRPIAIDHERIENRPMMYIALSYDHRIVDGKEAVSFLAMVKELLEDPETLLLEG